MSNADEFFEHRKPAAVLKHTVLSNYLPPFASMTGSTAPGNDVWYIDAFAGPGKYSDDDMPGSPSLALETAARLTPKTNLHCAFIEKDTKYFKSLKTIVDESPCKERMHAFHGSAADKLGAAFAQVGNAPALTFIDPFGEPLPRATLVTTAMRNGAATKTEVLVNFSIEWLRRLAAAVAAGGVHTPEVQKNAAAIDAVYGSRAWLEVFLTHYRTGDKGSATLGALAVSRALRESLTEETGFSSFAIPVRSDHGRVPLFELTLFYRSNIGLYKFAHAAGRGSEKWRKAVAEMQAKLDAEKHPHTLLGPEFSQDHFEGVWKTSEDALKSRMRVDIAGNIVRLAGQHQSFKIADHLKEIYGEYLGLATEAQLTKAWDDVAAKGVVKRRRPEQSKKMHFASIERNTN